ncbi:MAG: hypothetical protein ACKPKO_55680 [Candidatus Fonsibacter sp.]
MAMSFFIYTSCLSSSGILVKCSSSIKAFIIYSLINEGCLAWVMFIPGFTY